jgi:hypothetical protein
MKTLTVWQPWASLIIIGAKPFEFRTWDYRTHFPNLVDQRIVIHASQRTIRPQEVMALLARIARKDGTLRNDKALPLLERLIAAHKCQGVLELGAALGTAVLRVPRRIAGNFSTTDAKKTYESMWAWPLDSIDHWKEPEPMKGLQGFWDYQGRMAA